MLTVVLWSLVLQGSENNGQTERHEVLVFCEIVFNGSFDRTIVVKRGNRRQTSFVAEKSQSYHYPSFVESKRIKTGRATCLFTPWMIRTSMTVSGRWCARLSIDVSRSQHSPRQWFISSNGIGSKHPSVRTYLLVSWQKRNCLLLGIVVFPCWRHRTNAKIIFTLEPMRFSLARSHWFCSIFYSIALRVRLLQRPPRSQFSFDFAARRSIVEWLCEIASHSVN